MDVDAQAMAQVGTSTGEQMDDVPGVRLYDGSRSAVCIFFPHNLVFLSESGFCVWLESYKSEYSSNWVSLPRHMEPP